MSVAGKYRIIAKEKEGTFTLEQDGDVLSGFIDAMGTTAEIQNGEVKDNSFKCTIEGKIIIGKVKMTVKGSVDGDKISGTMSSSIMSVPYEGTRI